jgi:hypothetical protein
MGHHIVQSYPDQVQVEVQPSESLLSFPEIPDFSQVENVSSFLDDNTFSEGLGLVYPDFPRSNGDPTEPLLPPSLTDLDQVSPASLANGAFFSPGQYLVSFENELEAAREARPAQQDDSALSSTSHDVEQAMSTESQPLDLHAAASEETPAVSPVVDTESKPVQDDVAHVEVEKPSLDATTQDEPLISPQEGNLQDSASTVDIEPVAEDADATRQEKDLRSLSQLPEPNAATTGLTSSQPLDEGTVSLAKTDEPSEHPTEEYSLVPELHYPDNSASSSEKRRDLILSSDPYPYNLSTPGLAPSRSDEGDSSSVDSQEESDTNTVKGDSPSITSHELVAEPEHIDTDEKQTQEETVIGTDDSHNKNEAPKQELHAVEAVDPKTETDPFKLMGNDSKVAPGSVDDEEPLQKSQVEQPDSTTVTQIDEK